MVLEELNVGIAELKIGKGPTVLVCPALGSCVAIILYEPNLRIGALAHVMLPDSKEKIGKSNNSPKFADTAIRAMIKALTEKGADKQRLVAKIVGGAHMFSVKDKLVNDIGFRNAMVAKTILSYEGITVLSEDTGGKYGRTVKFYTTNGRVVVRSIDGEKEI